MKIVHFEYNLSMDILSGHINHLVLEDSEMLYKYVQSLNNSYNKVFDEIALVGDEKVFDLHKNSVIIFSPMDCIYEKREVQKRLYNELIECVESSLLMQEIIDIKSKIYDILAELNVISDYNLSYNEDFSIEAFMKAFNLEIKETDGNFTEQFIEFAINMHRLLGKQLIILVCCADYISKYDYCVIMKAFSYEGLSLLMIDGKQLISEGVDVNECIVDKDLCII